MSIDFDTKPQDKRELAVADAIVRAEMAEFRRRFPGLPAPVLASSERARVLRAARAAISTLREENQ